MPTAQTQTTPTLQKHDLFNAARSLDWTQCKTLIARSAKCMSYDAETGYTPLHYFVLHNQCDLIRAASKLADFRPHFVNFQAPGKPTALSLAAITPTVAVDTLRTLLQQKGIQFNIDYLDQTPIHAAAKARHWDKVGIIAQTAKAEEDPPGFSLALLFAAHHNNWSVCEVLLKRGAAMDGSFSDTKRTALYYFVIHEKMQLIEQAKKKLGFEDACERHLLLAAQQQNWTHCLLLIRLGASGAEYRLPSSGFYTLHFFVLHNQVALIQALSQAPRFDSNRCMEGKPCALDLAFNTPSVEKATKECLLKIPGLNINIVARTAPDKSLIHAAALAEDWETVQLIATHKKAGQDIDGYARALLFSAQKSQWSTCDALLKSGTRVNQYFTNSGQNAVYFFITMEQHDLLEKAKRASQFLDACDRGLFYAARDQQWSICLRFIALGGRNHIHTLDEQGYTPLHYFVLHNQTVAIRALAHSAVFDVNYSKSTGTPNALAIAATTPGVAIETLQCLLRLPNIRLNILLNGVSPIQAAAAADAWDKVEIIAREKKADQDLPGFSNALLIASSHSRWDLCDLLLQQGARADRTFSDGNMSAMSYFCRGKQPILIEKALRAGALEISDEQREKILLYAAEAEIWSLCETLLKRNVKSSRHFLNTGLSALHYFVLHNQCDLLRLASNTPNFKTYVNFKQAGRVSVLMLAVEELTVNTTTLECVLHLPQIDLTSPKQIEALLQATYATHDMRKMLTVCETLICRLQKPIVLSSEEIPLDFWLEFEKKYPKSRTRYQLTTGAQLVYLLDRQFPKEKLACGDDLIIRSTEELSLAHKLKFPNAQLKIMCSPDIHFVYPLESQEISKDDLPAVLYLRYLIEAGLGFCVAHEVRQELSEVEKKINVLGYRLEELAKRNADRSADSPATPQEDPLSDAQESSDLDNELETLRATQRNLRAELKKYEKLERVLNQISSTAFKHKKITQMTVGEAEDFMVQCATPVFNYFTQARSALIAKMQELDALNSATSTPETDSGADENRKILQLQLDAAMHAFAHTEEIFVELTTEYHQWQAIIADVIHQSLSEAARTLPFLHPHETQQQSRLEQLRSLCSDPLHASDLPVAVYAFFISQPICYQEGNAFAFYLRLILLLQRANFSVTALFSEAPKITNLNEVLSFDDLTPRYDMNDLFFLPQGAEVKIIMVDELIRLLLLTKWFIDPEKVQAELNEETLSTAKFDSATIKRLLCNKKILHAVLEAHSEWNENAIRLSYGEGFNEFLQQIFDFGDRLHFASVDHYPGRPERFVFDIEAANKAQEDFFVLIQHIKETKPQFIEILEKLNIHVARRGGLVDWKDIYAKMTYSGCSGQVGLTIKEWVTGFKNQIGEGSPYKKYLELLEDNPKELEELPARYGLNGTLFADLYRRRTDTTVARVSTLQFSG